MLMFWFCRKKEDPTDATKPTQPVSSISAFKETSEDTKQKDKEPCSASNAKTTDNSETNWYSRFSHLHDISSTPKQRRLHSPQNKTHVSVSAQVDCNFAISLSMQVGLLSRDTVFSPIPLSTFNPGSVPMLLFNASFELEKNEQDRFALRERFYNFHLKFMIPQLVLTPLAFLHFLLLII